MKACLLSNFVALSFVANLASVIAQTNVLAPGDPILSSSSNSPGNENVSNAIDRTLSKYLNFDTRLPEPTPPSGFVVAPNAGPTRVTGMRIQSANDAPERDPKTVLLDGSNDELPPFFNGGTWEAIAQFDLPDFTARFQWQSFTFVNERTFRNYRWTVTHTRVANAVGMQVAEVELLSAPPLFQIATQPTSQGIYEGAVSSFR